jgi:hypothetical protein
VREPNALELHVAPVRRHGLAGEQRADGADGLLERHQPVGRPRADLPHPRLDAVAERHGEPARVHARQARDLHRGHCGVAHGDRQQPDADAKLVGRRERGGGHREPAGEEAVLDQPQLGKAVALGVARERGQLLGRPLGPEQDAEPVGHSGHRSPRPASSATTPRRCHGRASAR